MPTFINYNRESRQMLLFLRITIKVWADLTFLALHDNQDYCRGNVLNTMLDIKHVLILPKINSRAQPAEFNLDIRRKLIIA